MARPAFLPDYFCRMDCHGSFMGALCRHKHVCYEVAGQRKASLDNSIHREAERMSQIFLFLLFLKQQNQLISSYLEIFSICSVVSTMKSNISTQQPKPCNQVLPLLQLCNHSSWMPFLQRPFEYVTV